MLSFVLAFASAFASALAPPRRSVATLSCRRLSLGCRFGHVDVLVCTVGTSAAFPGLDYCSAWGGVKLVATVTVLADAMAVVPTRNLVCVSVRCFATYACICDAFNPSHCC